MDWNASLVSSLSQWLRITHTSRQGCIKLPNLELIPRQELIYLPQNVAVFEYEYGKKFTSQWMILYLNVQFTMFTM